MSEREVIFKQALFSRLLLIIIQYVSNIIFPDHEADAFRYPKPSEVNNLDKIVNHFLGGFLRWDAQHFMHISLYGYTYEHSLAFFPFCPYLVRYISLILRNVIPWLNQESLTLLTFLTVNTFCFVKSALILYDLSALVLNSNLAYKSTILFCFNPASVFFTAPYTESVFCYLTFKSMLNCLLLYRKYCDKQLFELRDVVYIMPICLSTLTRSNGVLNIGFLVYCLMSLYLKKLNSKQLTDKALLTLKFSFLTTVLMLICVTPFVLFQLFCYYNFCTDFTTDLPVTVLQHKDIDEFVLPGRFSKHQQAWCFNKIPLAYSYIQSHYWKVGFLKYYTFKQVPNFLLASPLVFILLRGAFVFFKKFPWKLSSLFNFNCSLKINSNYNIVVYVIHSTILTVFCVLNIHVQVTTRMLCSASPVFYWFSAMYVSNLGKNIFQECYTGICSRNPSFILLYYLGYFLIGTVMFCNFLPWT